MQTELGEDFYLHLKLLATCKETDLEFDLLKVQPTGQLQKWPQMLPAEIYLPEGSTYYTLPTPDSRLFPPFSVNFFLMTHKTALK